MEVQGRVRVPVEPKDWVAGYAAVVATASLAWQVWNSYLTRRPQATLFLDAWRTSHGGGRRTLESVEVRIRNHEDYAILVDRLYLQGPPTSFGRKSSSPAAIEAGDVDELPFEVPPHRVVSLTLRPVETLAWRPSSEGSASRQMGPGVAMELGTGERYISQAAWR